MKLPLHRWHTLHGGPPHFFKCLSTNSPIVFLQPDLINLFPNQSLPTHGRNSLPGVCHSKKSFALVKSGSCGICLHGVAIRNHGQFRWQFRWLLIIWLLHNLVEASFDIFRYLLLGYQLKPWKLHPLVSLKNLNIIKSLLTSSTY